MIDRNAVAREREGMVEDADALEGRREIAELSRLMDLADVRGAEFRRLLRLAHTEGLLDELMQAAGCPVAPVEHLDRPLSVASAAPEARQTPPIQSPRWDRRYRRVSFGWLNPRLWFR